MNLILLRNNGDMRLTLLSLGECKHAMIMHLKCLKENQNNNGKCRLEAMRYLQCRMDK